jgi:hypothetical protein
MMPNTPPSDEALQEITNAAAAALTSPGEAVIGTVLFVLIEGPNGLRGQWAIQPTGASDAMLRFLRDDIDRILG